jgi:hypothetical protein
MIVFCVAKQNLKCNTHFIVRFFNNVNQAALGKILGQNALKSGISVKAGQIIARRASKDPP